MGALTLNAGSQLNYDLGQADVVGGPNNDLVQVNGNLALGGVVNVNAPGSIFANTLLPGSYRLINYTGTLSGSTTIGSIPSGFASSQIQTAVPSHVNLIAVQNAFPCSSGTAPTRPATAASTAAREAGIMAPAIGPTRPAASTRAGFPASASSRARRAS